MAYWHLAAISFPGSRTHADIWSNTVSAINTRRSTQRVLALFAHIFRWTFTDITGNTQAPILTTRSTRGNFTSLSRVSRHALANIESTTPSTVQTRNQAAFFLASRACKSMWTAALSRADTISVIPARGPTHRRQAGGSLKTLCANA